MEEKKQKTGIWQIAVIIGLGAGISSFMVDFTLKNLEEVGRPSYLGSILIGLVVGILAYLATRYLKE